VSPEVTAMPDWHVTVRDPIEGWAPTPAEPAFRWPHDVLVLAVTAVAVTMTGAVAGLIWAAVAPKLSLVHVALGSEAAFKADLGADMWFAGVTLAAGVACGVVAVAIGGRGPGVLGGLCVGGLLAALVAARVGYLADHDRTLTVIRGLHLTVAAFRGSNIDPFFRLHAAGMVAAWPIASLLVLVTALAFDDRRH
jgi:hypothetical protein